MKPYLSGKFLNPTSVYLPLARNMMRSVLGIGIGDKHEEDKPLPPGLRFIQFQRKNDKRKRLGAVSEDGRQFVELSDVSCVSNDFIKFLRQDISPQEIKQKISYMEPEPVHDGLQLLPPISDPSKIIGVALNYRSHCVEQNKKAPSEPIFFSKCSNTLVGARGNIIASNLSTKIDWEVELAVVMGKECKCVSRERAMDYVFGYTIAQDITAREWQKRNGGQFLLGKSMDSFCPLGPSIVHKSILSNPHILNLKCSVNGVEKQNGNTADLLFKIDALISYLSHFMTLNPGDVILTGTPDGVGMYRQPPEYLQPGDEVISEIQCIGKLINRIVVPDSCDRSKLLAD